MKRKFGGDGYDNDHQFHGKKSKQPVLFGLNGEEIHHNHQYQIQQQQQLQQTQQQQHQMQANQQQSHSSSSNVTQNQNVKSYYFFVTNFTNKQTFSSLFFEFQIFGFIYFI